MEYLHKNKNEKITAHILWENIPYEKAITSIKKIAESNIFN